MQEEERDPCIRNARLARSFAAFQVAQTALGTARVTIAGQSIQPPSLYRRVYTLICITATTVCSYFFFSGIWERTAVSEGAGDVSRAGATAGAVLGLRHVRAGRASAAADARARLHLHARAVTICFSLKQGRTLYQESLVVSRPRSTVGMVLGPRGWCSHSSFLLQGNSSTVDSIASELNEI
ncbi:hypothetical protein EVAR_2409_1 [Eumeta japonica]|uniref:Uncharacterized protein n=1 Tax=Eumeta variegata TaxID=151549 RepID=A0A4C1SP18_EUMVA|nr:hypothetical protein EVAR_2409_1 [Eumeta japonica]